MCDQAVDQGLVLGCERLPERGDIIPPLRKPPRSGQNRGHRLVVQHPVERELPAAPLPHLPLRVPPK